MTTPRTARTTHRVGRRTACLAVVLVTCAGLTVAVARANVTLSRFVADSMADRVRLTWETASEFRTAAFFVERSLRASGGFIASSNPIPAAGGGVTGATYVWEDKRVQAGTTYFYRLVEIETDQNLVYHDRIVCATPGGPPCAIGGTATLPAPSPSPMPAPTRTAAPASTEYTHGPGRPSATPTLRPFPPRGPGRGSGGGAGNPPSAAAVTTATARATSTTLATSASGARTEAKPSRAAASLRRATKPPATGRLDGIRPGAAALLSVADGRPGDAAADDSAGSGALQPTPAAPGSGDSAAPSTTAAVGPTLVADVSPDPSRDPSQTVPGGPVGPSTAAPAAPRQRLWWVALIGVIVAILGRRVARLLRFGP